MWINLSDYHRWEIIGSGGKTTFLVENAKRLSEQKNGKAGVIFTTSTHLAPPSLKKDEFYPGRLVECKYSACGGLTEAEKSWRQVEEDSKLWGLVRLNEERNKWIGFSPDELDMISLWPGLDYLLVEADGSKRLPIKAHASHEPVLYSRADLGVAVIGLQGLGRKVIDGEVHRAELMCRLLQCCPGSIIGPVEFVKLACAYLSILSGIDRLLVFSQAERADAELLAQLAADVRRCSGTVPIVSQAVREGGEVFYQYL
ncbi:MAG: selenium cofactor biosynthesis protein YqeC [Candidatus Bruticola sp.]